MASASFRLTSSIVRLPRVPSARARSRPPTISITAISQIWSVFSSMVSANSPPMIAAGRAETTMSHPRRPSFDFGFVNAAFVRRTMSCRKYATAPTSVPRCRATSNVFSSDSLPAKSSHPNSHGTRMR